MTIVLQDHARPLIVEEFISWAKAYPRKGLHSEADGLQFFQHLKSHRADLLQFRSPGHDQWPIIRKWLVDGDLMALKSA